jgi:hypothetical protein
MSCGHTCHLVQHGETAVDLFSGGPVLLDGAGQVLAEAGVKKVIVIPDLETGLGEEIGEILLEVLGSLSADDLIVFIEVSNTSRGPSPCWSG